MSVRRLWPGSTIVCIGGGPSLTPADVDACRGRARVIAINDAYRLAGWADVLYACDDQWWRWHHPPPAGKGDGDVTTFSGLKYALHPRAARWPGVTVLRNTGSDGLELDPSGLRAGMNGGYQAINLAVHLGAARILLLGYDMQRTGGKSHWFGDHPRAPLPSPFVSCRKHFKTLVAPLAARGVHVINCSRQTALTCFPRAVIHEVLEAVAA